jgi:hypothetical protein
VATCAPCSIVVSGGMATCAPCSIVVAHGTAWCVLSRGCSELNIDSQTLPCWFLVFGLWWRGDLCALLDCGLAVSYGTARACSLVVVQSLTSTHRCFWANFFLVFALLVSGGVATCAPCSIAVFCGEFVFHFGLWS